MILENTANLLRVLNQVLNQIQNLAPKNHLLVLFEVISVEPGPAAVGFIGPVIPGGAAKSTSEQATNQTAVYVEDEGTDPVVEQNGNGSMESLESATVQSSGLQMS